MTAPMTYNDSPRVFLTDYASYNNGSQFEFGHWIDLDDFSDEIEFSEYVTKHLKECDKKSPLDSFGSIREEPMYTDFENFPRELYCESLGPKDLEEIYEYINLTDSEKVRYEMAKSFGYTLADFDKTFYLVDSFYDRSIIEDIYETMYPDVDWNQSYFSFDWEHYKRECLTEFTASDGSEYLIVD